MSWKRAERLLKDSLDYQYQNDELPVTEEMQA